MDKSEFIWMDGEFVPWDEAKIHVLTHSLHYGSAVFEGVRLYKTHDGKSAIFRLQEHIDRLFYSASAIDMEFKYTKEDLKKAILELIKKNKLEQGYIRPLIYYGYGKMGLFPGGAPVNVSLSCWAWGAYLGDDSVKVKVSTFMRIHPKSTDIKAKISGHYANSIIASLEARREGYNEALLLDYEGNVSEGPGENVYYIKDGVIYTPDSANIVDGITRDSIFEIAKNEGIEIVEKKCSVEEFTTADEAFFTGTAAEIIPIVEIDDSQIGDGKPGQLTNKLQLIFTEATQGKLPQYFKWLTYVE